MIEEQKSFIKDLQVMVKKYTLPIQMAVADKSEELFNDKTVKTIVEAGAKLKRQHEENLAKDFIECCNNSSIKMYVSVLDYTESYENVFYDLVIKNLDYKKYRDK